MLRSISRRDWLLASGAGILAGQARPQDPPGGRSGLLTADDWIRRSVSGAPLSMRFPGETAAECRSWQSEFSSTLKSLLGPHAPPERWETVTQGIAVLEDHRREQLLLLAENCPPLPVYLLLPLRGSGKRGPGVLAIHGHGEFGYHTVAGRDDLPGVRKAIQESNYDYGRQMVRLGYAVVIPCLSPFGPRLGNTEKYGRQDPCADTFMRLQMLGKLLIAENVRDCLWALRLLAQRDEVDSGRLGCVGLSYGGRMTMLVSALDPKIRVAVISGALNVMQERIHEPYSCGAQIIPGLLKYGDVPEIGSLIAPRPCLWEAGSRDTLIPAGWSQEALTRMGRAYKALGAEKHLHVDRFEGGHQWHGKVAYPFLAESLM
jgi:dienelactone hydrolase